MMINKQNRLRYNILLQISFFWQYHRFNENVTDLHCFFIDFLSGSSNKSLPKKHFETETWWFILLAYQPRRQYFIYTKIKYILVLWQVNVRLYATVMQRWYKNNLIKKTRRWYNWFYLTVAYFSLPIWMYAIIFFIFHASHPEIFVIVALMRS